MIGLLSVLLLLFFSYYFACNPLNTKKQGVIYVGLFVVFSVGIRILVNVNLNNDYYYYYSFGIFHKPTSLLSYLVNEPYLYSVYAFFSLIIEGKKDVFLAMYWFNFLINTLFFIWLSLRKDVETWKKMLLFVLHYFLFGFVVLRNGPAYILFAMYFYYTFRQKQFKWVFLTPFMHISSCLMLVTYFHKWKYYYKALLISFILITLFFIIAKPFLLNVAACRAIVSKIEYYLQGMHSVGRMHFLFFICITSLIVVGVVGYKNKMAHPILITTILFYGISFVINPIVAHRFSPYVIFALLLYPFDTTRYTKVHIVLNRVCIFLFPLLVYAVLNTHKGKIFLSFL